MDESEPAPEKPRYLLPDGCKDLYDVIRLQLTQGQKSERDPSFGAWQLPKYPQGSPSHVNLPDPVTVRALAEAIHLAPH